MTAETRFAWIDALRLIAGLSMLGLHASTDPAGQPFPDATITERIGPMMFRAVAYMARTELFVLISLFLLMLALDRRPRSYQVVIREQSRRLLVPFLFWTIFFALWSLIKAAHYGYLEVRLNDLITPTAWLGYFLLGDVKYHMHFLPTLFGIVLIFPLYKIGVRFPWSGAVLLILLAFRREADLFLWRTFSDMAGFEFILRAVKIFSYAGYGMIAGALYGVFICSPEGQRRRLWLFCAGASGLLLFGVKMLHSYLIITTATWQFSYTPGYWADALMPCLLFATAMLVGNRSWLKKFSHLAPYSFGIYLCHPIFIDIYETLTRTISLSPNLFVAGKVTFTLLCTCIFVWTLARIKWLAWTIGLGPLPVLYAREGAKQASPPPPQTRRKYHYAEG